MFYLNVDGSSYDLVDGLQYLIGQGENPLRVSGDYPFGTYTFTGDVADEWGYKDGVTVDITFNDKPVAYDDDYQTDEDVAVAIVLTVDDEWPGSGFTWIVGDPANGTLSGTAPNLTYTPDADFYGKDSFTFHVNDGFNDSNVATITIDVLPLNDSPLAVDDHYATPMSTTLNVAAPGVLDNDIDPDPTDLMIAAPIALDLIEQRRSAPAPRARSRTACAAATLRSSGSGCGKRRKRCCANTGIAGMRSRVSIRPRSTGRPACTTRRPRAAACGNTGRSGRRGPAAGWNCPG